MFASVCCASGSWSASVMVGSGPSAGSSGIATCSGAPLGWCTVMVTGSWGVVGPMDTGDALEQVDIAVATGAPTEPCDTSLSDFKEPLGLISCLGLSLL